MREVPITPITNGVHLPTWVNADLAQLYDNYLAPDWRERYPEASIWEQVPEIPSDELWEVRRRRKRRLIGFVRERLLRLAHERRASSAEARRCAELFDPEALTIGFARRFATYKRATLLFRDKDRLKRILNHPQMPVQIIVAGKAHPKDNPGKQFIREIVQLSRDPDLAKRLVFLEDYDIEVAREMVQGVDLWLNTPRRGEEACGTSGMKAAMNGTLNLSILDGWFDEVDDVSGGWAIGDREPYAPDMDDLHASAIYSLLENEIVPMFYKGQGRGGVARLGAAREDVPDEPEPALQLPAHGGRLCHTAVRTGPRRIPEGAPRQLPAGAREGALERATGRLLEQCADRRCRSGAGRVRADGHPDPAAGCAGPGRAEAEDVRVEAVVGRVNPDGGAGGDERRQPAVHGRTERYVYVWEGLCPAPDRPARLHAAGRAEPL